MFNMTRTLPKKPKHYWLIAIGALICLCIIAILYFAASRPRYVILDIPSPISYLPRGSWYTTEYTTQDWVDSHDRYYIWRRETVAYSDIHDTENGYSSWASVVEYFDKWLVEDGWTLYDHPFIDPCRSALPESEFLVKGEDGYLVYHREAPDSSDYPIVCLAIWPVTVFDNVDKYRIVLVTVNPSTLTKIRIAME